MSDLNKIYLHHFSRLSNSFAHIQSGTHDCIIMCTRRQVLQQKRRLQPRAVHLTALHNTRIGSPHSSHTLGILFPYADTLLLLAPHPSLLELTLAPPLHRSVSEHLGWWSLTRGS